jgi:hypothetical protein
MDRDTLDRVILGSRLAADRGRQHTIKEPGAGQAPPEHFQDKHALAKARVESGFPSKKATMLKCWSGFFLRLTRNRSRARIVGDSREDAAHHFQGAPRDRPSAAHS